jgi:hypothetical protein
MNISMRSASSCRLQTVWWPSKVTPKIVLEFYARPVGRNFQKRRRTAAPLINSTTEAGSGVAITGGESGCDGVPGDGEEPQQGTGKKGSRPGPVPPGAPGAGSTGSKGMDPSDQIGPGRGESVVSGMSGATGWFKTSSPGSEGEVGTAGVSEMRFPQRARARCLPSVKSVSPA